MKRAVERERRRNPRAQLALRVRLRWPGPLGHSVEVCDTLDLSRSGLLLFREDFAAPRTFLWVTFPYDPLLSASQPEMPARVVRAERRSLRGYYIALQFEPRAAPPGGNGDAAGPPSERRGGPRQNLSLPVRVRPDYLPWHEETMTLDFSTTGLRFASTRVYEPGRIVYISLSPGLAATPWATGREISARILRVESLPGSNEFAVAVTRAA